MKWDAKSERMMISDKDMEVLAQCGALAREIFYYGCKVDGIPPVWSVLSYVLLQENPSSTKRAWRCYRRYLRMAKKRDKYYWNKTISKSSGGRRTIAIPLGMLALYQRQLSSTVLEYLAVSPCAYAYRKGVNIRQCAEPHVNQELLFHLDIKGFFGSITEDMVYERLLKDTGYPKSLCRFFARLCCYRGRLPQGAPTSPILSNIVFRPCDEVLSELADQFGLRYTRYSDDLFFSGGKQVDQAEFLARVERILFYHGFRMNKEKTRVLGQHRCQTVLGLTVNERVQVNRKYKRKLLQEVYYLERFGEGCNGAAEEEHYYLYMQKLLGRLVYALSIEPDNMALWDAHLKLQMRLFHFSWDD